MDAPHAARYCREHIQANGNKRVMNLREAKELTGGGLGYPSKMPDTKGYKKGFKARKLEDPLASNP